MVVLLVVLVAVVVVEGAGPTYGVAPNASTVKGWAGAVMKPEMGRGPGCTSWKQSVSLTGAHSFHSGFSNAVSFNIK